MEFYFIRHGETPGNLQHKYIGVTDESLAPEGQEKAKALSGRLLPVDRLWVSPMARCRETAALLWPGVRQKKVADLRECDFGAFEGKSWEELKDDPTYRAWIDAKGDMPIPGGEAGVDFNDRCRAAVEKLLQEAFALGVHTGAVVAHGGTIMAAMNALVGESDRDFYGWRPDNCCGYRVEVSYDPIQLTLLEEIR